MKRKMRKAQMVRLIITMVVYSRDDEGVGVAHNITSPDGEAVLIPQN